MKDGTRRRKCLGWLAALVDLWMGNFIMPGLLQMSIIFNVGWKGLMRKKNSRALNHGSGLSALRSLLAAPSVVPFQKIAEHGGSFIFMPSLRAAGVR